MAEDNADNSKKSLWIIIICAGIVTIGVALALLLKDKPVPISETDQRAKKIVATAEPAKTPVSEQQPSTPSSKDSPSADKTTPPIGAGQPVVDYGKLKDDKELQALMDKRKEKFGFEKGVDLIVKPDESVKVGDEVIPMQEILEKIRLERGEVIEKDITDSSEPGTSTPKAPDAAVLAQKRVEEIEKLLKASDKPATGQEQEKEKKIEQIVSVYKEYKSTEEKIKEKQKLLKNLEMKKEILISQKQSQERSPEATQQTGTPKLTSDQNQKPEAYIPIKPDEQPVSETISKKAEPIQQPLVQKPVGQDKKQSIVAKLEPKKEQKPEAYIPIKPGEQQAVSEDKPSIKVLVSPEKPKPKADQPAPKYQIIQKERKVKAPKERPPESASPKPVPEIKKPEGRTVPIQKPIPSTKEMAKLESYMKSIQDDINTLMLKKGDLESELKQLLTEKEKPEAYGIYVVQNGDNIWDVHFAFLTEYFTSRGIVLSRTADEPDAGGKSSGVGKILKFSENIVYIYNTRDRRLEKDINMIHPLSKIVVFNMGQVFELLDRLAYGDIEKIEFDGDNLWLPAES